MRRDLKIKYPPTYMLKFSFPHLMKTDTMPTKSATQAQAVTHCGIPDTWCHPCQPNCLDIGQTMHKNFHR